VIGQRPAWKREESSPGGPKRRWARSKGPLPLFCMARRPWSGLRALLTPTPGQSYETRWIHRARLRGRAVGGHALRAWHQKKKGGPASFPRARRRPQGAREHLGPDCRARPAGPAPCPRLYSKVKHPEPHSAPEIGGEAEDSGDAFESQQRVEGERKKSKRRCLAFDAFQGHSATRTDDQSRAM